MNLIYTQAEMDEKDARILELEAEHESFLAHVEQWKQHFEGAMADAKWQKDRRLEVQDQNSKLEARIRELAAALDKAVSYIMLDSEYPSEVVEWADLVGSSKETPVEPVCGTCGFFHKAGTYYNHNFVPVAAGDLL